MCRAPGAPRTLHNSHNDSHPATPHGRRKRQPLHCASTRGLHPGALLSLSHAPRPPESGEIRAAERKEVSRGAAIRAAEALGRSTGVVGPQARESRPSRSRRPRRGPHPRSTGDHPVRILNPRGRLNSSAGSGAKTRTSRPVASSYSRTVVTASGAPNGNSLATTMCPFGAIVRSSGLNSGSATKRRGCSTGSLAVPPAPEQARTVWLPDAHRQPRAISTVAVPAEAQNAGLDPSQRGSRWSRQWQVWSRPRSARSGRLSSYPRLATPVESPTR